MAIPNQLIDRRLPMLLLYFRQNQFAGVAVIKTAKIRLYLQ